MNENLEAESGWEMRNSTCQLIRNSIHLLCKSEVEIEIMYIFGMPLSLLIVAYWSNQCVNTSKDKKVYMLDKILYFIV